MVSAVSETTSLLRQMAAEVKERKGVALTPNAAEAPLPDVLDVGAPFPYDKPAQDILAAFTRIEIEMDFIRTALGWVKAGPVTTRPDKTDRPILSGTGGKAIQPKDPVVDEESFEASLAVKSARAQAEVFGPAKASTPETPAAAKPKPTPADDGWKCPEHGKAVVKTNKAGRTYRSCPQCGDFELFS